MDRILELKNRVSTFVNEREWKKFHNPKDIAISISIESAELLENFQWRNNEEVDAMLKNAEYFNNIKEEMADVLIYLIILSNKLEIDLIEIAFKKLRKNEKKYPADKFKGKAH
ncbi:MAG: nucleotide pyrophosphohydrolase [Candidatus Thermoplasmatota archaeon]|nr:nucleotide pyrophosphohydrolase [Candidatus Thermoplasmatota archaeon]